MLKKGDIIFTGTPAGVSKVNSGDELVGSVEGEEFFKVNVK
jgi:2-keto-4-pentenoate hydratase/2-oxohepta-3-ene-1,7-dioic acid hydratase in catechol pathway